MRSPPASRTGRHHPRPTKPAFSPNTLSWSLPPPKVPSPANPTPLKKDDVRYHAVPHITHYFFLNTLPITNANTTTNPKIANNTGKYTGAIELFPPELSHSPFSLHSDLLRRSFSGEFCCFCRLRLQKQQNSPLC